MLYIKLFIEREKNTGQSAPECPFKKPLTNCFVDFCWKKNAKVRFGAELMYTAAFN